MSAVERVVTIIPATINPRTHLPTMAKRKRRVAGYARVSTDKDEQFTSYEAQVDYYTQYISRNPEWEFVQVYTDEGLSGLNTRKRDGFNQMIADALNGGIDLIVTKSVSRFARNTVDSLTTIRKLKENGIEVYFEKENIWTFDGKGELLLTIMASLAQEESRSISENVTWGKRKQCADGKVSLPYKSFLGYDRGEKKGDPPIVNEEQAVLVRRIYRMFMDGKTTWMIAQTLTQEGIPTPAQKVKWSVSTVESILTNEKYRGSAILQKTFTTDFLEKKLKVNEGEVPQYYIEHSHQPIIPPDEWDRVQKEFARRKSYGRRYSGRSIFSSRIICGDCGGFFGSKVWNSTNQYRRTVWQCNAKFKNEDKCQTPHLDEQRIKDGFVTAFNRLYDIREEVMENVTSVMDALTDCSEIETERMALAQKMEDLTKLIKQCVAENARAAQNQDEYRKRYDSYVSRFNSAQKQYDGLEKKRLARLAKAESFKDFLHGFQARDSVLAEFDETLWERLLDTVTVHHDGRLIYKFYNGAEIEG